jgi:hypothetical protein
MMRHYIVALLSLILDFILILGITAIKTTPWDCLLLDDCTALSSRCKHSQLKRQFFCGLQDSVFNMRHYVAALLPLILEFILLIGITTFNGPARC